MKTTDVAIVGAGPCGLMLACELGRRGIAVDVIEVEPGVATAPQANATQARTMEHYRRLGLSQKIRALGLPQNYPTDVAYFTTYAGHELARFRQPASAQAEQQVQDLAHIWNGAEMPHRIPQSIVENVLYEHASAQPNVTIRFEERGLSIVPDDSGVTLTHENVQTGERDDIRAKYLFGADGASGITRKSLGVSYSGGNAAARDFMGGQMLSVYLHAPAFYDVVPHDRAWMYWTFNLRRRGLLAATDGVGGFVFQTQLRDGETAADYDGTSAGALFAQAVGVDLPFEVTGLATWVAGRALVADAFGGGRVFIGGDAAHIFTPTGGMGYNTAIEDAVNMGWKLAAVVKGQAGQALLESYPVERRPVALRNTRFALDFADSVGLFRPSPAIEDDTKAGVDSRARAGAYLNQHGAREFTIPGFTFGARHDASPVIVQDDAPIPPDAASVYVPSAKPGGRAPHVWLAPDVSLFDKFGFEWTLVKTAKADHNALVQEAEARGVDLTILDLSNDPRGADLYEAPLALVRPDQTIAWRGDDPVASDVWTTVLGR